MKLKFESVLRAYLFILIALFGWSFWAMAQGTNTNAVATVQTSGTGTGILSLPVAIDKTVVLSFGLHKFEALQRKILGNPAWQYIAFCIYVLLAFYVSALIDFLINQWLKRWAAKTKNTLDDMLLSLLRGPVKIISFVIFLHIGLNIFAWPDWFGKYLSKGLTIIIAASLTYVLVKGVDFLMEVWKSRTEGDKQVMDSQLFPILRKALKTFVVIIAVLVTSQNLGLNITGLIASLSIGGLALGLAAQDTIANLFGAVSVFLDKPFKVGDFVKVDTAEGIVETIGLRSTRVRNLDGHLISVPNKIMGNAIITNIALRPTIRTILNIGITYDTPPDKIKRAIEIIKDIYRKHPMTHDLLVFFDNFAASSLNIQVVHWWKTNDFKGKVAGIEEMNLELKRRFDEEKISFAFPTQTLYLKQDSEFRLSGASPEPRATSEKAV